MDGAVATGRAADRVEADDFASFYRGHVDRVYRALAVTLRRDDLAREAVDEAMARAYARWSTVRGLDNPAGWVFRVGLNWATSWWRKVRRERYPESFPVAVSAEDHGLLHAREALARLPLPQRSVVTCRILLDLTTAETAAGFGVALGLRREPPSPAADPAVAGQRLMLNGALGVYPQKSGDPVSLNQRVLGELDANGKLVAHPAVGVPTWFRGVGLYDGRMVVLGAVGLTDWLVVVGPRGEVLARRELRDVEDGYGLTLLAADDDNAYVLTHHGLVAHDLASGRETTLVPAETLSTGVTRSPVAADVLGTELVVTFPGDSCRVWRVDLSGAGAGVQAGPIGRVPRCERGSQLRMAPDGSRVALAYTAAGGERRVAVLAAGTGKVERDVLIVRDTGQAVTALAWSGPHALRVADLSWLPGREDQVSRLTRSVVAVP